MDFSRNTLLRNVNLQGESTAVRKSSAYQLQKTGGCSIHSFVTNPPAKNRTTRVGYSCKVMSSISLKETAA